MIAHLRGTLLAKQAAGVAVIEAAGVGYEVAISITTFAELPPPGHDVRLHVYTHVREDAIALYGFLRAEEKQLFQKLIAVSGIGPRMAINILSGMQPEALVAAVRGNDIPALTRTPGIGKKTAERMVLELRDKLDSLVAAPAAKRASPLEEDVLSALVNLGYPRTAAERALEHATGNGAGDSFEALFRTALGAMKR